VKVLFASGSVVLKFPMTKPAATFSLDWAVGGFGAKLLLVF
jgi:hypothetical protein